MTPENVTDIIEIDLFWSPDDQEYVVRLACNHGVSAFGKTIRKALRSFSDLLPAIVEIAGVQSVGSHLAKRPHGEGSR